MKPILIHYPYAINQEHQQLQTSIKGGATPEQSAQQYIMIISSIIHHQVYLAKLQVYT